MPINKLPLLEEKAVQITFDDAEVFVGSLSDLDPAIVEQLALHGLGQKLGDSYAASKEIRDSGEDVNQWAKDNVKRVWGNLVNKLWTVRGEGGARITQLVQAVFDVYSKKDPKLTVQAVAEKLADMSKEDKQGLSKSKSIAARIAIIQAEKAAEKAKNAAAAAADESGEEGPELTFG